MESTFTGFAILIVIVYIGVVSFKITTDNFQNEAVVNEYGCFVLNEKHEREFKWIKDCPELGSE